MKPKRTPSRARPAWTVLIYIAGDVCPDSTAVCLKENLKQCFRARLGPQLQGLVQYDGPEGAERYALAASPNARLKPIDSLSKINSGAADSLADFLNWGLALAEGDRVALLLCSVGDLSPQNHTGPEQHQLSHVFTMCRDDSAGGHFDLADLGSVIDHALTQAGRAKIDLVGIDSCEMQFLELAYELENRVDVLMSSQNYVPDSGWNYERLLTKWGDLLSSSEAEIATTDLAVALAPVLLRAYEAGRKEAKITAMCGLSVLDLGRLDDVSRAFDTLCITVMQALGESLIWETRNLLLEALRSPKKDLLPDAYDCGRYFFFLGQAMEMKASVASQSWLGSTMKRFPDSELHSFYRSVARHLRDASKDAAQRRYLDPLIELLTTPLKVRAGASVSDHRMLDHLDAKLRKQLFATPFAPAQALDPNHYGLNQGCDMLVHDAIVASQRLLPRERSLDYQKQRASRDTAVRIARQAHTARTTVNGDGQPGLVLWSQVNGGPTDDCLCSGVSIYRPRDLRDLVNESYQRFAFHQRVHWAPLLGAVNLIADHPRAMWRLISSLLSTGSGLTRRELLDRMTGRDSVIWGMRTHFRAMVPAPTLTLSLERRQHAKAETGVKRPAGEYYLLRLDSTHRGAIVTEQESRVQSGLMRRALTDLDELLNAESITRESYRKLMSLSSMLGDDVLQALGQGLEEERQLAARADQDSCVHLQLQIPRELMRYPWELIHHQGEWLGERFALGRQVFMETGLARRVPKRIQGRLRVLIIGDPILDEHMLTEYSQLPGARREAEQVAGLFESLFQEIGEIVDFNRERDVHIGTRLTNADLRQLLRTGHYDIVHFAGHGSFETNDPETSAWILSDAPLWALEIRNVLQNHPAPPWFVYSNACESAMESATRRYQGNVFGLATAFINHGVAAYLAPLWPIDDDLAQSIALQFYRELIGERVTLGEALRRAKATARSVATPSDSQQEGVWASLGWASLVLYGDPTAELFQGLGGTSSEGDLAPVSTTKASPRSTTRTNSSAVRPILHAPDHELRQWVDAPKSQRSAKRGAKADERTLELVEEAGLRRWRIATGAGGKRGQGSLTSLPGSPIAQLLDHPASRARLPGRRGLVRVIGRWVLSGLDDGLTGLVRGYDHEQVGTEQQLLLITTSGMKPLVREDLPKPADVGGRERILILIHGTFSKTQSPVDGLGKDFLAWAHEHYRAVIGFDHWTLSVTPEDNADVLLERLHAIVPEALENRRIDIVCHSRGGLVARAFCELRKMSQSVRHLIFIATPNCGTDLANPKHAGALADRLVNMSGLVQGEVYARLAGLLARAAAFFTVKQLEEGIPGLKAQNPAMATEDNSFLARLQVPDKGHRVSYAVIAADYEPTPLQFDLKGIWNTAKGNAADLATDSLFQERNDLVVNTAHTWCIDQGKERSTALPAWIKPSRVLVFGPQESKDALPKGVTFVCEQGMHHCNLFGHARTLAALREWLSEESA